VLATEVAARGGGHLCQVIWAPRWVARSSRQRGPAGAFAGLPQHGAKGLAQRGVTDRAGFISEGFGQSRCSQAPSRRASYHCIYQQAGMFVGLGAAGKAQAQAAALILSRLQTAPSRVV